MAKWWEETSAKMGAWIDENLASVRQWIKDNLCPDLGKPGARWRDQIGVRQHNTEIMIIAAC